MVEPTQVTFTDGEGVVHRYATDGKKGKHQLTNGVVETKSAWKDGRLTIEFNTGQGMKTAQTYAVDPGTGQLAVTMTPEGGGRGRVTQRVATGAAATDRA